MTSRGLQPDFRRTYALVDLDAVRSNVAGMLQHLKPGCTLAAIVKADAYGHGSVQVGRAALEAGASVLGVAMAEEALPLRAAGLTAPILVIGPSNGAQLVLGADLDLDLCVFTPAQLRILQQEALRTGRRLRVHLKLDTGMGRIGIRTAGGLISVLETLKQCPDLDLAGLFTHFACADNYGDQTYTEKQHRQFMMMAALVREYGYAPKLHVSNSAAAQDLPQFDHDVVRFGISLYGYPPSDAKGRRPVPLIPAMEIWAEISRIAQMEPGDSIGYGASYTADRPMRVATVQIGYGDGLNRLLSNRGFMIVPGPDGPRSAPVVGRICMDMTMIDISCSPHVREGDMVLVMGSCGQLHMNAGDMAELCGTISYEILLDYTARLPRLYKGNHG